MIFPTPVSLELGKRSITLGNTVTLTVSPWTGPEIVRLVRKNLESAGVDDVSIVRQVPNTSNNVHITLEGKDENGLFHAAQTFRQLAHRPSISVLVIKDHPLMPIRGIIEGFYGAPLSMADRKNI